MLLRKLIITLLKDELAPSLPEPPSETPEKEKEDVEFNADGLLKRNSFWKTTNR